jgi:hypothetical protein
MRFVARDIPNTRSEPIPAPAESTNLHPEDGCDRTLGDSIDLTRFAFLAQTLIGTCRVLRAQSVFAILLGLAALRYFTDYHDLATMLIGYGTTTWATARRAQSGSTVASILLIPIGIFVLFPAVFFFRNHLLQVSAFLGVEMLLFAAPSFQMFRIGVARIGWHAIDRRVPAFVRRGGAPLPWGASPKAVLLLAWAGFLYSFAVAASVFPHLRAYLWSLYFDPTFPPIYVRADKALAIRRRLLTPSAIAVRKADARPPVLFLRSFNDDLMDFRDPANHDGLTGGVLTFEELLTDRLWTFGPVVAIGRPNEVLPPAGAAREYVSDNGWQTRVTALASEARLVVMVVGITAGLGWEFARIIRMGFGHKVILAFPPCPDLEAGLRWRTFRESLDVDARKLATSRLDVRGALAVFFAADGRPVVLTARTRDELAFTTPMNLAAATLSTTGTMTWPRTKEWLGR